MSFIAYLCWLLGISVPADCNSNSMEAWAIDACAVEEGDVDSTKDGAQHNGPPRHSRGSNIDVSI
jgi:hypothetical protein